MIFILQIPLRLLKQTLGVCPVTRGILAALGSPDRNRRVLIYYCGGSKLTGASFHVTYTQPPTLGDARRAVGFLRQATCIRASTTNVVSD